MAVSSQHVLEIALEVYRVDEIWPDVLSWNSDIFIGVDVASQARQVQSNEYLSGNLASYKNDLYLREAHVDNPCRLPR